MLTAEIIWLKDHTYVSNGGQVGTQHEHKIGIDLWDGKKNDASCNNKNFFGEMAKDGK